MRTALFAIIIANIICAFDAFLDESFYSMINTQIFTNISTAIVTYVELKETFSQNEPSYIDKHVMGNKAFSNIDLGMITTLLANGAEEGPTKNELLSFSNVGDLTSLNERYLTDYIFLNNLENIEIYIGTTIYVQNSIDLTSNFSSICKYKLHCSISKLDFRNNIQAAEIINSGVQETTNYQILDIITPDNVDENAQIMLVNTVYFNIRCPIVSGTILDRKFYASPSNYYFVPTIKFEKSTYFHGEIKHWDTKFIEIPFLNDNVVMIILLPNEEKPESLNYLLKKFNLEEFQSIRTANAYDKDIELYLPKFTIYYIQNMTNYFRDNGATTMFEDEADFTRLSKIPLKVSNIAQKFHVRIRKDAETLEVVEKEDRKLISPLRNFIVDHPFMYIIEINGVLEFIGAIREAELIIIKEEL
ncbi:antitrypsin-like [Cataglyphis hispanica]|uniref:antitrypsin-like n=1 Tax=Cataglyphis hispanica TaxID=1086592 RepID=UPI00217FDA2D|nr:antitrypsin-like [Cataglyphis hispanica]